MLALGNLLNAQEHFAPKAKSVIWLFMEGGPSGFDLFDYKPELQKNAGKRVDGIETFFGNPGPLLRSPYSFRRYGQSGATVCEKYARVAECVDDIAFIKSCWAESNNHGPAMYQINTGLPRVGFPSVGSWVTYGLGSENRNLPGFVVLGNARGAKGGPANWGSGFLPSSYQGTLFRANGTPILNLDRPEGVTPEKQRAMLDAAASLNGAHLAAHGGDGELDARIQSFEMAYRMQMAAKELVDFSGESDDTKKLYGLDVGVSRPFGEKCLLARRLVERGVRVVQLYYDAKENWDSHESTAHHEGCAKRVDQPIAALLTDLKQRGLLEDTLVLWGGEFGRTPTAEGNSTGRDHNHYGFTVWLAGAGVKGGLAYGATDEFGFAAVDQRMHVHDLHATILHLMGLNHEKLLYRYSGRDFRLTDVEGVVAQGILA
jgi:hypothetical protein